MEFIDVLFVDDNELNRFLFQKNLERHFRVRSLESAKELYACLKSFRPKVLVLDWMMPEVSGLEILSTLRALPQYRDLIIIILTAKNSQDDIVTCLNHGANDYIVKPPHYPELIARIQTHMRQKEAERSIRLENQLESYRFLVSGLRHEYNNIFGALRLFLQMVDQSGIDYFQSKKDDVFDFIQRGLDLMNAFRELFVADLGDEEEIELNTLIRDCANRCQHTVLRSNEIRSVIHLDSTAPTCFILGHAEKLRRAFGNLINNALHAVQQRTDGKITLSISIQEDQMRCICIEDNGIGIEPDNLRKLGDIFFTTKGSFGGQIFDQKTSGTGLGIPIANQIFRLHGASMEFQSVLREGTRVCIRFPPPETRN